MLYSSEIIFSKLVRVVVVRYWHDDVHWCRENLKLGWEARTDRRCVQISLCMGDIFNNSTLNGEAQQGVKMINSWVLTNQGNQSSADAFYLPFRVALDMPMLSFAIVWGSCHCWKLSISSCRVRTCRLEYCSWIVFGFRALVEVHFRSRVVIIWEDNKTERERLFTFRWNSTKWIRVNCPAYYITL